MSEQGYRSLFAVVGLILGILLMVGLGRGGMIWGFIFGAGGATLGGMFGETLARRWKR